MKYFLHDTNAFQDEKITELFMKFGYEGIGLFFTALERLAAQEKPIKTSVLKKQLSVGKKLEKVWAFMEQIELISSNNGETFNENLLKFSEKYKIQKEKTRERVAKHRESQEDIKNVTRYNRVSNAPKVKVSKVKDTNVSKSKSAQLDESKQTYRENVTLKTEEYQALVAKYGQPFAERCLDKLSSYKLANGKDYKSDYGAINSWVIDQLENMPIRNGRQPIQLNHNSPVNELH